MRIHSAVRSAMFCARGLLCAAGLVMVFGSSAWGETFRLLDRPTGAQAAVADPAITPAAGNGAAPVVEPALENVAPGLSSGVTPLPAIAADVPMPGAAPMPTGAPAPTVGGDVPTPTDVPMPAAENYPLPTWASHAPCVAAQPTCAESTWYTRVDYFHWIERFEGASFDREQGPLFTLGYQRANADVRYRSEVFGSQVDYHANIFFGPGDVEPLTSYTNYLGVRGEYEWLFEPESMPVFTFFGGIGTRLWSRDLPNSTTANGNLVLGYEEIWWTTYPYLGVETRHDRQADLEWYVRSRVGVTAMTFENVGFDPAVTLYPRPGLTAQAEGGVSGKRLFVGGFFEMMGWSQSGLRQLTQQPNSKMFEVGLKTGLSF